MSEIKTRVIFSNRIARQILNDDVFNKDLIDIKANKNGSGQSVFVFRDSKEFSEYISRKFNLN